jgi:hypothetical protein
MRRTAATAGRLGLGAPGSSRRVPGRRWLPVALALCLGAALGVAALRVDLLRVRYGLADALQQEKALLQEQREMRARVGELRDPARLAQLARRFDLVRPRRIVHLATPAPGAGQP